MDTPSYILSNRIIERLVRDKIILPERSENVRNQLATGRVGAEDWKFEIELKKENIHDQKETEE